jgi:hypothetical protein
MFRSGAGSFDVEEEAGDPGHIGGAAEEEPLVAEEGGHDAGREDGGRVAAGELGGMGSERRELAVGDGGDGDADVGAFDAEVGRCDGGRVAEDRPAEVVLGAEEAGGEGSKEDGRRRGGGFDGGDDGAVEGEVVGVAVGAVGAEGEEEVGGGGADGGGDGVAEAGLAGEAAVGETGGGAGFGAEDGAGAGEFGEAEVGEGSRVSRGAVVALAGFAGGDGDDGAGPAGAGGEGEGPCDAVRLIVGVGDEGEDAGHRAMVRAGAMVRQGRKTGGR